MDSTDDDPESGIATEPGGAEDLPLVGIDLVGYVREPALDPEASAGGDDLTYAAFTGDEPDVLGPMITASSFIQTGDTDPGGTPVDLDGDGDAGGESDGRMTEYENGATTVTWTHDSTPPPYGRIAVVNGHGVPPEDVLIYAQQLSGVPFDLETMPAPERLPNREVVTFEPTPDFPSRVASYQGPSSVVHVLTTSDRGYFDLTRIVSTEGEQYEEIPLGRTFLGPGAAILSPDDDGMTSALVRTDSGLTVHVFGRNVDAGTLRTAIRYGHLVDLSDEGHPLVTTVPTTTTVVDATTTSTTIEVPETTAFPLPSEGEPTLLDIERTVSDDLRGDRGRVRRRHPALPGLGRPRRSGRQLRQARRRVRAPLDRGRCRGLLDRVAHARDRRRGERPSRAGVRRTDGVPGL